MYVSENKQERIISIEDLGTILIKIDDIPSKLNSLCCTYACRIAKCQAVPGPAPACDRQAIGKDG